MIFFRLAVLLSATTLTHMISQLQRNDLSGTLPSNIGKLARLSTLYGENWRVSRSSNSPCCSNLAENNLSGTIDSVAGLLLLDVLYAQTLLGGYCLFVCLFFVCQRSRSRKLSHNRFSGTIPTRLFAFTGLAL